MGANFFPLLLVDIFFLSQMNQVISCSMVLWKGGVLDVMIGGPANIASI